MPYRLFIFDFDGTLSDSFPWFTVALNQVADELRFRRVQGHEVTALRKLPPRALMRHLDIPMWKVPIIGWRMRRLMARGLADISLFDGVHDGLRELRARGATVALVTSNSRANVERVLGPASAARIQHYECGASMFGKASRFRRVLRRSGVPAAETICIGDELRDLDAARQAGLDFGAVAWGFGEAETLRAAGSTALFRSFTEIVERASGQPGR